MSNKKTVIDKFPNAFALQLSNKHVIMPTELPNATPIGSGRTAQIAWEDAAKKISGK